MRRKKDTVGDIIATFFLAAMFVLLGIILIVVFGVLMMEITHSLVVGLLSVLLLLMTIAARLHLDKS